MTWNGRGGYGRRGEVVWERELIRQCPKVEKQEKKKQPKGRASKLTFTWWFGVLRTDLVAGRE